MLNLTTPELYKLTMEERLFVHLYNKWGMRSSGDPIEQFRQIKNPQGLNVPFELNAIDEYLEKKFPGGYEWPIDSWVAWIGRWLKNTKRKKASEADPLQRPFYEIMWDHYLKCTKFTIREEPFRSKYERIWNILTDGIETRVKHNAYCGSQENRDFTEVFLHQYQLIVNGHSLYDELDARIVRLISAGYFEDEAFMLYLGRFASDLLRWVLDLKYGPEYDKCYQKGDMAFDGRRNRGEV